MAFQSGVREEVCPVLFADELEDLLLVLQLAEDGLDQPLLALEDLEAHVGVGREVSSYPAGRDLVVAVSSDDDVLAFDDFAR